MTECHFGGVAKHHFSTRASAHKAQVEKRRGHEASHNGQCFQGFRMTPVNITDGPGHDHVCAKRTEGAPKVKREVEQKGK